jgi:hypothetical protein
MPCTNCGYGKRIRSKWLGVMAWQAVLEYKFTGQKKEVYFVK